jgi:hypothetical protein
MIKPAVFDQHTVFIDRYNKTGPDKYNMQLLVYINGSLVTTLSVTGDSYSPTEVITEVQKTHPIGMGDQVRIVPIPSS